MVIGQTKEEINQNQIFVHQMSISRYGESSSFQEILLQLDLLLNQSIHNFSSELIQFGNNLKILILQKARNLQQKSILKIQLLPETFQQIESAIKYSIDLVKSQFNLTTLHWKTQVNWENLQKKYHQQKRRDDRIKIFRDRFSKENQQQSDVPKLDLKCPLCTITFSNVDTVFKHMKETHELHQFDCNFHCIECEFKKDKLKEFIEIHLFRFHGKLDEMNDRYYQDPETGQKYYLKQQKQLRKQISQSLRYTRITEQFELLMKVATAVRGNNQPQTKQIKGFSNGYIRGQTKIVITPEGYQCPICQENDSKSLKILGTHIKNVHKVPYPNHLFCPHCLMISTNRLTLAEHLLMKHRQKENFTDGYYQVVGTGEKVYIQKRLSKIVLEEEPYHTFFNPDAPEIE